MADPGFVGPRHSFVQRMLGAAMLDVNVYEEVEADSAATAQAAAVVALAAIASAIGSWGDDNALGALIGALVGWAAWAAITYFIGATVFKGTATWGELLRTLGFAQAPGVLSIAGLVPLLGPIVRFVIFIWILIAGIIAIRQALDISTGKAVAVAILGWLVLMLIMAVFAGIGGLASLAT